MVCILIVINITIQSVNGKIGQVKYNKLWVAFKNAINDFYFIN